MTSEWVQLTENTHTEIDGYTVFTFKIQNFNPDNSATNTSITPNYGYWQKLLYKSHEASRGIYNPITNTWTITILSPGETATLTVTTTTTPIPQSPTPTSTKIEDINRSKLIGQKVITKQKIGDEYYAMLKSTPPNIGDNVLLRQSDTCGYITTGATSTPSLTGRQNKPGLNPGRIECSTTPGNTLPIECPGPNTENNGNVNCPTEPSVECLTFPVNQVRGPTDYTSGINGGKYYHVNFEMYGLDGMWIYPGLNKPIFYADIGVAGETAADPRDSVPDCWPEGNGGAAFNLLSTCEDPHDHSYNCERGCCLWPGDTNFTTLYSNVCPGGNSHYGVIWHPDPGGKFQFWYPYGALWIFVKKAGVDGYMGPGGDYAYPTGYTYRDGDTPWSILGGPDYILGVNSDNFKDDYDPKKTSGRFGTKMDYDTCMEQLKIQVRNDAERDAICREGTQGESQEGWTDCMKRLYNENPTLTPEQLSTMCNEHPDWTTCMINTFYSTGGTMTEQELMEACNGSPNNYGLEFYVGLGTEPFLITDMVFCISGTLCAWGWPNVPLWWSNPNSSVTGLRVCMPTEEDLKGFEDLTNRETEYWGGD